MSELNTLIHHMKERDHFEMLGELSGKLSRLSEKIDVIHHSLEGSDIMDKRSGISHDLVEAFILIEVTKVKLSVMAGEWNTVLDATIKEMIKEYANFEEMEF